MLDKVARGCGWILDLDDVAVVVGVGVVTEVIFQFHLIRVVTVSRVVPVLGVVEVKLLGGQRRAPRAHGPEAQHPAAANCAEVTHHPAEDVPAVRRAVPLNQDLADSGGPVLPCGVQITPGPLRVERYEGVEVRLLAHEQQAPIIGSVDSSRDTALGQSIAVLEQVLVLAIGEPDTRLLREVGR